jgi:hypothetical protein
MGNVGEGAAVHEGRIVLQGLHEIRLERVLQQYRHRSVCIQLRGPHGLLLTGIADNDVAQTLLEILQRGGRQKMAMISEATTMSKPSSRGKPLPGPPREHTMSRRARSFISTTRFQVMRRTSTPSSFAVVDMVVQECRQQVVGQRDRVEIAGEVEVDVLHGHDLGCDHHPQRRPSFRTRVPETARAGRSSPSCRSG